MAVNEDTIAIALGRATPTSDIELEQWAMWVEDARRLIRHRLGDLDALDQETLDYVVREAVVAHIRRPDDATQVDIRVDDGAVGKTYRSSAGRVTIRDEWWDLLSPETASGAFSIRPYGSRSGHAPWCDLMFNPTGTCSCGYNLAGYPMYEPVD